MTPRDYYEALKAFDWFYEMSDDHQAWRNGEEKLAELTGLSKKSCTHEKIYRVFRAALNNAFLLQSPIQWPPIENFLPKAAIFDIDGTLFDDSHRRKYLNEKSEEGFKKYHSLLSRDKPIETICDLLRMHYKSNYTVILLTGRPIFYERLTKKILKDNCLYYHKLYMRPEGNRLPTLFLKKTIYEKWIFPFYTVKVIFDDERRVSDVWRSLDLTCCQTRARE